MTSERAVRMSLKEQKAVVKELICDNTDNPTITSSVTICATSVDFPGHEIPFTSKETDYDILRRKLEQLESENAILKNKITEHENNEKSLSSRVRELENRVKMDNIEFDKRVKQVFKEIFSENQIDILLKNKSKARWTSEELSKAFTLRYFSKRAYIYLREKLHYPLPGISTLQHWAANINLRNGILEDILRIMDISGQAKSKLFRVTVLSFDEVKISSVYEYCEKEDEVLGPHNYMQVVMARGLFDQWKQPLYMGFDKKMTKDILENIICELHKINYAVVACVSDCGSGNQGLWKGMAINVDKTFCEHPITKKPIYFFADVPHLLKLLRNWFIDTGFVLADDIIITKDPVKLLINSTNTEISSCHKLTLHHVNCERTQRQNVKLAAQLFSNTTATALKQYQPGDNKKLAKDVGEFFQLVNNWFDIMNSFSLTTPIPSKKPYGTNLHQQNDILQEMLSVVSGMKCIGKNTLQVFQKGMIMSIKSLRGLYAFLEEELNVKYILTHRLNQDCLEKFFSQVSK